MTLQHAESLLSLGRPQEALTALNGLEVESAQAHCLRARAFLALKRWKDAEAAATAAITAAPELEWGYRLASIAVGNQDRRKEARRLAKEAVRVGPHEAYAHQIAALTALDVRDKDDALVHAREMARLAPWDAKAHRTLGRCQLADRQLPAAEESLRKALELDPQDHEAMTLLAEVVGAKDKDLARDLRVSALRANPQSSAYRKNVLRRGGLAAGGTLFAVGKLGLLGKLVAIGTVNGLVNHHGDGGQVDGTAVVAVLVVLGYVGTFTITRIRRRRHGRELPPLVWEGTKADRRNADLKWFAWPAGLGLVIAIPGALGQLQRDETPWAFAWAAALLLVLGVCFQLRSGDARSLSLWAVLKKAGSTVFRHTVFSRLGSRR